VQPLTHLIERVGEGVSRVLLAAGTHRSPAAATQQGSYDASEREQHHHTDDSPDQTPATFLVFGPALRSRRIKSGTTTAHQTAGLTYHSHVYVLPVS
jgi:hypothetical protein